MFIAGIGRCVGMTRHMLIFFPHPSYQSDNKDLRNIDSMDDYSRKDMPYHENTCIIQEIVLYFASRIRAAWIALLDPANTSKDWMHRSFVWEIVMSFVIINRVHQLNSSIAMGFVIRRHGRGYGSVSGHSYHSAVRCVSSQSRPGRKNNDGRPRTSTGPRCWNRSRRSF